jgi:hypothetical protein
MGMRTVAESPPRQSDILPVHRRQKSAFLTRAGRDVLDDAGSKCDWTNQRFWPSGATQKLNRNTGWPRRQIGSENRAPNLAKTALAIRERGFWLPNRLEKRSLDKSTRRKSPAPEPVNSR